MYVMLVVVVVFIQPRVLHKLYYNLYNYFTHNSHFAMNSCLWGGFLLESVQISCFSMAHKLE